jgi:hypothetical protein
MPYLKRRHGNVCNKPPLGGMAAIDTRVDLLKSEFLGYDWQGALYRWFFIANCDDKMVL